MKTYAVLSDIHANGRALSAAVETAGVVGADQLVVLGDLLTYGVDVAETLQVVELLVGSGAHLIIGNHDKLYMDLAEDDMAYYERLPEWIRESVDYNWERLDVPRFLDLPWETEFADEQFRLLFAHANPFGYPDWTYLNSDMELERAGQSLTERGYDLGCFGHTHRPRIYQGASGAAVTCPGSVGQPRTRGGPATIQFVRATDSGSTSEHVEVAFDVAAHLKSLSTSGLSDSCVEKLQGYFSPETR